VTSETPWFKNSSFHSFIPLNLRSFFFSFSLLNFFLYKLKKIKKPISYQQHSSEFQIWTFFAEIENINSNLLQFL
jgi:hypothetical protein